MAKLYAVYAAIPGKEPVFFNSYLKSRQAYRDYLCLKEIGLETKMEIKDLNTNQTTQIGDPR